MLLLKFDCSGGAAIKDRAHSRLIIDGATKNCSIILFQKKRFIPLNYVFLCLLLQILITNK